VLPLDQLAYDRGLVVGERDLLRELRADEPVVEPRDRQQPLLLVRGEERRGRGAAPALARAALCEHGMSFREPARHAVVGHAEMERVRQLVPERRAPVERATVARGRRVHGQYAAEADAERA